MARGTPGEFIDESSGSPPYDGTRFLKLRLIPHERSGCELYAEVASDVFAGEGAAWFRDTDIVEFIERAREFSAGRRTECMIQGGAWDKGGRLVQVLVGLHIYVPGGRKGQAAVRVVVARHNSDDLLTTTLHSQPMLIAQFADEIAALVNGAREAATLIGK